MTVLAFALAACGAAEAPVTTVTADTLSPLVLDLPEPVALDGRPLRVVATTSIIGDVVDQVGGDVIDLTTLMGPGQDPHSYQPAAADLTAAANADVIFINGWDLEQGLVADLESISENGVIIPVSAGITPLAFGEHEDAEHEEGDPDHDHGVADPHTWLDVDNVSRWTATIAASLSALDPANEAVYGTHAAAYVAELAALDTSIRDQLAAIPETRRVLVTNHDSFAYFADAYGFEVLGTIIPGASTLAEPTASDLAALVSTMKEKNVCALFTESTVSSQLGQTVAAELDTCDNVAVLPLYSGALGQPGSGADTYVDMMRSNVAAILDGLQ